ncbi:MAG: helix-turn-helix domain-containing protein [Pseudonocardiaceae bacterium]
MWTDRTIGWKLQRIRDARGKTLRVVAGLAGMSTSTLHRIEHGEPAVTLSEIVALANALEVAPSELTKLPVPAPANGHTDATTEAVRLALDAIDVERPGGVVLPVTVARDQVARIHAQRRTCRFAAVARAARCRARVRRRSLRHHLRQCCRAAHVYVSQAW